MFFMKINLLKFKFTKKIYPTKYIWLTIILGNFLSCITPPSYA